MNERILKLMEEKFAPDYLLRQLAEECAELAQAALKMIRFINEEAPHLEGEQVRYGYFEELADVKVMLDLAMEDLPKDARERVAEIADTKRARMAGRLEALGAGTQESCAGCRNDLGGGMCRANLEAEYGKGGHEAWTE